MAAAYSIAANVSLRACNTLGVDATAAWVATVHGAEALPVVLGLPQAAADVMVLGEGSNVLFARDYPGLVLRLAFDRASVVEDDGDSVLVRAEAGCRWDPFVDWTLQCGARGLENLALIPGLAGAAPIPNIGAYGVAAYDRHERVFVRLAAAACRFGYRDSVFKADLERWIVCALELRLPRRRELALGYAGIGDELAAMGIASPSAAEVAEAVRRLRRRKLPDPAIVGNAGSFFKNPIVEVARADALRASCPAAPVYPAGLIEQCGWRGFREGDAGISAQHALVLVNHGRATGEQLLAVARRVATSVHERFGVTLEPEPRIVGAVF
jgi:UDP-N-acetylmuramate dehydrogenase